MAYQNPIGRMPENVPMSEVIKRLERLAYCADLDNRTLDGLLRDIHALRILGDRA